jgi:hypothetical protein
MMPPDNNPLVINQEHAINMVQGADQLRQPPHELPQGTDWEQDMDISPPITPRATPANDFADGDAALVPSTHSLAPVLGGVSRSMALACAPLDASQNTDSFQTEGESETASGQAGLIDLATNAMKFNMNLRRSSRHLPHSLLDNTIAHPRKKPRKHDPQFPAFGSAANPIDLTQKCVGNLIVEVIDLTTECVCSISGV